MKHLTLIPGIVFSLMLSADGSDSGKALQSFSTYEQGKPLVVLIEARRAVFHGTDDDAVRTKRERELLAFLASDAHPQAKALAIDWLGCLGSAACVPALAEAGKDPALAAPAAAAIQRIQGAPTEAQDQPTAPVISKEAGEVAAFTSAIDADAVSPAADERIAAALRSNNDLLAGAALRRIRAGAGSPALAATLLASPDPKSASRLIPLWEALAPRAGAAEMLRPILLARIKSGDPETRADAVKALGRMLRPDDLPMILGLLADTSHAALSTAAEAALLRSTSEEIDPALIRLTGEATPTRIAAIDALAARHALPAIDPLWALSSSRDPQVATAAYKALGILLRPDQLDEVVKTFSASHGSPSEKELGKLVWNVVRRHPDPAAAADLLDDSAADAPAAIKELLQRYATRIRPKSTSSAKPAAIPVNLPANDDRRILAPNGHEEIVYLDCGTSADVRTTGGVVIRRTAGTPYQFGETSSPQHTIDSGKEVRYEISGLDATSDYVIGFTAWDADLGKRRQSFTADDVTLLPDVSPISYAAGKPSCTRIHLPLPRSVTADGKALLTMACLAGPNAVVSELWLLRRTATTTAKRVLILTGDDYPSHLWRETGPEFARILRADPRLEVTISESPAPLGSQSLSSYDAVFLHFKNYSERVPTTEALWKNLEAYVNGGGGLVIGHFGCGALQEWNGFVKVAGRIWDPKKRGHDPFGEFVVRILETGHPITRDLKDFSTHDELYTCLTGDTRIEVLADATSKVDKSIQPMAFVLTPGKGRVFHSPLGHNLKALEAQGTRDLYLNGTLWAAGLEK